MDQTGIGTAFLSRIAPESECVPHECILRVPLVISLSEQRVQERPCAAGNVL